MIVITTRNGVNVVRGGPRKCEKSFSENYFKMISWDVLKLLGQYNMSFDAFSISGHDKHENMKTKILNDVQKSLK